MWDEEELMIDIALKRKTVCENAGIVEDCEMVFTYVPLKKYCDECAKRVLERRRRLKNRRQREYRKENLEKVREIERMSKIRTRSQKHGEGG